MIKYRGRHRAPWIITVGPWVRRNPLLSAVVLILALWAPYGALDATGALWSLRSYEAVSVAVEPPACPSEAGGPTYPCTWECAAMGNGLCGPETPPLVIYRHDPTGEINVCMPLGTGEVCAPVESDARIEAIGDDGRLYLLAGGGS